MTLSAVCAGSLSIAQLDPEMVEICAGDTPLHDAATWSKKNFVELLVRHGAVVDAKNENGRGLLGTWKSDEK